MSFNRHQQRSEILICFLLRRQVFLKISFLDTQRLAKASRFFLQHFKPRFRISRQQQRGEILICFRSIVKRFLKILSNHVLKNPSTQRTLQLAASFSAGPPFSTRLASRLRLALRFVISEAHDCSTGILAAARVHAAPTLRAALPRESCAARRGSGGDL